MATTKSELDGKVRGWILRTHPEEKDLIGDFDCTITWREVARRMLAGECFYDICECTESVQREYAFQRLSELFETDYDFWYFCYRDTAVIRNLHIAFINFSGISTFRVIDFLITIPTMM